MYSVSMVPSNGSSSVLGTPEWLVKASLWWRHLRWCWILRKEPVMQRPGRRTFQMWKYPLHMSKVTKLNKWLLFYLQSSFHTWNSATSHSPWPHHILHLWDTSNKPSRPPQKGDAGAVTGLSWLWAQGHVDQLVYDQRHQVPGIPPVTLILFTSFSSGVEPPGPW